MKIAIYSRKSINTGTGNSIENQISIVKDYFKNEKCTFEIFEDEGWSGGNVNRPQFQKMLKKARMKNFDVVAVYKLDRIARNIVEFMAIYGEFDKLDVRLVSVTEGFDPSTPVGKMQMVILAAVAEMERENIKQRVSDNMKEVAKMGRWNGGSAPFGYKIVKGIANDREYSHLEATEDLKVVSEWYRMFLNGYKIEEIARLYAKTGAGISNSLRNATYCENTEISQEYFKKQGHTVVGSSNGNGFIQYGRRIKVKDKHVKNEGSRIFSSAAHKAAVSSEDWIRVQEIMKNNNNAGKKMPRISKRTFLAQLIKCNICGALGIVQPENRKPDITVFRFSCNCNIGNKRLFAHEAEMHILNFLENLEKCKDSIENYINKKPIDNTINIKQLIKDINLLKKQSCEMTDKIVNSPMRVANLLTDRLEKILEQLETKESELKEIENINLVNKNDYSLDAIQNRISNNLKDFQNQSIEEQQRRIRTIIEVIHWDSKTEDLRIEIKGGV